MNIFSKRNLLLRDLTEIPFYEKGKLDHLFEFLSEFLLKMLTDGLMLENEDGVGGIEIPKTKAMKLIYPFYSILKNAVGSQMAEFILENEYKRIILFKEELNEEEFFELTLFKTLTLSVVTKLSTEDAYIDILMYANYFCSPKSYTLVYKNLEKVKNILKSY